MKSPNCYIVEMFMIHEQKLESSIPGLVISQKTVMEADRNGAEGYNPNKGLSTHGRILETPLYLTDDMLYPKEDGFPIPRRGVSGEDISRLRRMGIMEHNYYPSFHSPETVTRKDLYDEFLEVGDTIHFYYKANPFILPKNIIEESYTEEKDMFGQQQKRYVIKVDLIHSVCSSREGIINKAACGITVASKVMQEESDIRTSSGIFTHSTVQPKYLTAKAEYSNMASKGSTILYFPKGNFEMDILGKQYYVIKDRDVLCEMHGN